MPRYDTFNLRFPSGEDMRERLEAAAEQNGRSLHEEVLDRLRASLEPSDLERRVAMLEQQVAKLARKR